MSPPSFVDDTCEVIDHSQLKPGHEIRFFAWKNGNNPVKWLPVRNSSSEPLLIGHPTMGLLNGRVIAPHELAHDAWYAIYRGPQAAAKLSSKWNGRCRCGARTFTLFSSVEHEGACR